MSDIEYSVIMSDIIKSFACSRFYKDVPCIMTHLYITIKALLGSTFYPVSG